MKKVTLLLCAIGLVIQTTNAQVEKLSGPRFGFTYLTDGSLMYNLNDLPNVSKVNPLIAQFGWQFERHFMNTGRTAGIVEFIPLIGGFEQGLFLPSFSTLVGIRNNNGFEFAIGPNISLSGIGMVLGTGFNIKSGDINFPINEDNLKNIINFKDYPINEFNWKTGHRISIIIGFNASKN